MKNKFSFFLALVAVMSLALFGAWMIPDTPPQSTASFDVPQKKMASEFADSQPSSTPSGETEAPEDKLIRLIKEKDPVLYAYIKKTIDEVMQGKKTVLAFHKETMPKINRLLSKFLPYSDQEALIASAQQFLVTGKILNERSPEACRQYVLGNNIPELMEAMPNPPSPEFAAANLQVFFRILETTDAQRVIPTDEEVQGIFAVLLVPSADMDGTDIALLTNSGDPRSDPGLVCQAFLRFYERVLKLPSEDAEKILRYRFFHIGQAEEKKDRYWHELRLSTDRTKIILSGYIGSGVAREFEALLNENPTVRDIYTNGEQGGLVGEARAIRDLIHTRQLTTRVTRECVSACTIVFLGGVKRYLYPEGKIGFHRYTLPGFPLQNDQDERQDFLSFGVSAAFADKVFAVPSEEMWYPEKSELFESGVTTTPTPPPHR